MLQGKKLSNTEDDNNSRAKGTRNVIGILNFQYSNHNFGAVLQAAALAHCVARLGYEVEHINYIPEFERGITLRRLAGKFLRLIGLKKSKKRAKGSEVFEQFRVQWLNRSPLYKSASDLQSASFRYRAIIVGSDQVWRPNYTIGDPLVYFLNFADDDCRRIAYAASFGSDRWLGVDPEQTANVGTLLSKFQHISCREDSGVQICEEVFGSSPRHVLDPTLLAGKHFFESIFQDRDVNSQIPRIVYYKLDLEPSFLKVVDQLKIQLGEASENIYFKKVGRDDYYLEVAEWLLKIKNARMVITDSYHCVCFAILFNKPFVCLRNESRGYTRIQSLLCRLGISNRECVESELVQRFEELLQTPIEYSDVNRNLEKFRRGSMDFLVEALRIVE